MLPQWLPFCAGRIQPGLPPLTPADRERVWRPCFGSRWCRRTAVTRPMSFWNQ